MFAKRIRRAGGGNGPMKHGFAPSDFPYLRIVSRALPHHTEWARGLLPLLVLVLVAAPGFARTHARLTTLAAVSALTNGQANRPIPVEFKATVVYSRGAEQLQFVQDGDKAIFVEAYGKFEPGDRILVKGLVRNSYRPIVIADSVKLLRHGDRPQPVSVSFSDLITGAFDCRLVAIRGRVRSADLFLVPGAAASTSRMQLTTDGGRIEVNLDTANSAALKSLLDADVEITGAAAGVFNDKMQLTGVMLYVSGLNDVQVLQRAGQSPSSLPITPMDRILDRYRVNDLSPRVRVQGTITYYRPGIAAVLQDGKKSLWIATHTRTPLTVGDKAYATGFPDAHDRILTLDDGEITDEHVSGVADPMTATWKELAFWSDNLPAGHQNDLVSIEGRVVTQVREPFRDDFVLDAGGHLFSAILYHSVGTTLPALPNFEVGAKLRVTGVCAITDLSTINPPGTVPFEILLRSLADVEQVSGPPLLGTRNQALLGSVLILIAMTAIAWGWWQETKVHRHSELMAQLEQRRSCILESISTSRPLVEILEQIASMISSALGADCWFEVSGGARLGQQPENTASTLVVSQPLSGQGGAALGTIFVAIHHGSPADKSQYQAIQIGARLAVVAIETNRLYSDLTYRSEYDALTGTHNRFSLGRFLNEQIRRAREDASVFALIYLDLDFFKQVNDRYGHQAGDEYLQQVANRMKRQLRPGDLLARLGGDEFAAIVPNVRGRAEVDEISRRLASCFQTPFLIDGHSLRGSASIGLALYPQNGDTDDELLSAADSSMYQAKRHRARAKTVASHSS